MISLYAGKKLKDKNEVLNEKYWDVEQEKIEVSEEYQRFQAKLEKSEAAVSRLKDLLRTASAKLNKDYFSLKHLQHVQVQDHRWEVQLLAFV